MDKTARLKDGSSVLISKYYERVFEKIVEMYSSLSEELANRKLEGLDRSI
jgi:hypothetical protein